MKTLKNRVLQVLSLLFVLSTFFCCIKTTSLNKVNKDVVKKIKYTKDPKTGLCYGTLGSYTTKGFISVSITCVPCEKLKDLPEEDFIKIKD